MTPAERRAIAMRQGPAARVVACEKYYPECCSYHEGFDDALALLVPFRSAGGTHAYVIEAAP